MPEDVSDAAVAPQGGMQVVDPHIHLWNLDQGGLDRATATLGGKSIGVRVNIADWDEIERAAAETTERLGGIDILAASAGITGPNATL